MARPLKFRRRYREIPITNFKNVGEWVKANNDANEDFCDELFTNPSMSFFAELVPRSKFPNH